MFTAFAKLGLYFENGKQSVLFIIFAVNRFAVWRKKTIFAN